MNMNNYKLALPSAALLFVTATAFAQLEEPNLQATNRFSLSLRFGLNIHAQFKGIAGSLNPSSYNGFGRRTPDGAAYNYDNGYVLSDRSGNAGGHTWNWGYDSAGQADTANHTVAFERTTASASGGAGSAEKDTTSPGFEFAYDRQLGVKEDWHHMRYGLEGAFNFQTLSVNNSSTFGATAQQQTDTYGYTPGTTLPTAPYQGSFAGPGFVLNVPRTSTSTALIPNATVSVADDFSANLWGFRLGPYLEFPFGEQEQLLISVSGGLALGILDATESWKQTANIPGIGTSTSNGSLSNMELLWGGYLSLSADYRLNKNWGVMGGVQFQSLQDYSHTFDGRQVKLDLSRSVFVLVGVSYSF
jgi:hypothetical protein